jgi:hypothetical protein
MKAQFWKPPKLPQPILKPKISELEDIHIRSLMKGQTPPRQQAGNLLRQAIPVDHYNANTGFSHRSLGFRFRRYGK